MHLAMTAQVLTAEESLRLGLVTGVVEDQDLEKHVLALAQRLAAYPPTGMKNINALQHGAGIEPCGHAHARSGVRFRVLSVA